MKIIVIVKGRQCITDGGRAICPFNVVGSNPYCIMFRKLLKIPKERLIAERCRECKALDKKRRRGNDTF